MTVSRLVEVSRNCMAVMAAVKHSSFREEQEWRLLGSAPGSAKLFRPGRHGIVPYVELPFGGEGELSLQKIWIGPNTDQDAAQSAIELLSSKAAIKDVIYEKSTTPYRG